MPFRSIVFGLIAASLLGSTVAQDLHDKVVPQRKPSVNRPQVRQVVVPELDTVAMAQAGEPLLRQGQHVQRAAIHLSKEIKFGAKDEYTLTPGYYIRTGESDGWETYSPADGPDAGRVKKTPGAITLQGSFQYSSDGKTVGVITNFYQAVNAKATGITRTTLPSFSAEELQRMLVFGGKTGTKIKLAYREVWKNITRPSQDDFVEFELAESQVIEFKGARIEVIDATNTSIRYRVTRSFESTEK